MVFNEKLWYKIGEQYMWLLFLAVSLWFCETEWQGIFPRISLHIGHDGPASVVWRFTMFDVVVRFTQIRFQTHVYIVYSSLMWSIVAYCSIL